VQCLRGPRTLCKQLYHTRGLCADLQLLAATSPCNTHKPAARFAPLCRYLAKYEKILVIVSHSQDFMNGVCTNILHMQKKKVTIYSGNYDTYVQSRKQLEEQQMKKYNWEQEQARLVHFLRRSSCAPVMVIMHLCEQLRTQHAGQHTLYVSILEVAHASAWNAMSRGCARLLCQSCHACAVTSVCRIPSPLQASAHCSGPARLLVVPHIP
jgi:dihydroxyacetone kinase DhaKLM complex PTS-EIIA-like component DhaM